MNKDQRYRLRHPERIRASRQRWQQTKGKSRYQTRRTEWLARLGGCCAHCGTTEGRLDFDHIDPATKTAKPSILLRGWTEGRIADEMNKCQVLCVSCHSTKTRMETR